MLKEKERESEISETLKSRIDFLTAEINEKNNIITCLLSKIYPINSIPSSNTSERCITSRNSNLDTDSATSNFSREHYSARNFHCHFWKTRLG